MEASPTQNSPIPDLGTGPAPVPGMAGVAAPRLPPHPGDLTSEEPPWPWTRAYVAQRLHVSERTIRRRLKEHPEIRPIKPGRQRLFDRSDFHALKEALRVPSRSTPTDPADASRALEDRIAATAPAARSAAEAVSALRRRRTKRLLSSLRPTTR